MSREILTLQFGHSANFVGTHFWNIQESGFHVHDENETEQQLDNQVDHDVMFREGRNIFRQVTFTPRLVLYDLKDSLKTLPECGGSLYAEEDGEVVWNNDVTLHKAETHVKNEFLRECEAEMMELPTDSQTEDEKDRDETDSKRTEEIPNADGYDFDKDVEVWSDFLGTQFHPRSLSIIKDYYHGSGPDTETSFDLYVQGWNILGTSSESREAFEDEKIRFFAEECDYLQGFQLLCDAHNGFSGMAAGAAEHLLDEYHGRPVFSLPLCPMPLYAAADTVKIRNRKLLNFAMCLASLGQTVASICPLSYSQRPWTDDHPVPDLPWINCDYSQEYQSSAIFAAAIDSLTLGCRMKSPHHPFGMYSSLADCGQKLLTLDVSLPLPLAPQPDGTLYHTLTNYGPDRLFSSLSPFVASSDSAVMKEKTNAVFLSLRGVPDHRIVNQQQRKKNNLSAHLSSRGDFLGAFVDEYFGQPFQLFSTDHRLPLRRPFPRFFCDSVNADGDVIDAGVRSKSPSSNHDLPMSVAVASCLRATGEIGQNLQELRRCVEKVPPTMCLPPAANDVFEMDDVKSILENFYELCDNY